MIFVEFLNGSLTLLYILICVSEPHWGYWAYSSDPGLLGSQVLWEAF